MAAAQVPKTQKAAIYDNPGTISTRVVEVGVPEPGEGEVLVRLYVGDSRYAPHLKDEKTNGITARILASAIQT
jgi:hypothetical protein